MPVVSVIMPVHNREVLVQKAVESVLRQRFDDFELLAVDDHSTDRTHAVLQTFAERDPRVRVIQSPRRGVSAARNAGLAAAKGEIYAYLDSDNTWRDNHLQRVVSALRGRVRGCCYTKLAVRIVNAAGELIKETVLDNAYDPVRILRGNAIDLNAFAHTAQLYQAVGGFDESMDRLVDWDFIIRVTRMTPPQRIDAVTGDYLHHQSANRISQTAAYNRNRLTVALKHRMTGQVPRVRLFGPPPDGGADVRWRETGLAIVPADKAQAADGRLPVDPDDVVIWRWTPWDDDAEQLDRAVAKYIRRTSVSLYFLPGRVQEGRRIGYPRLARGFDFVVVDRIEDKLALQRLIDQRRDEPQVNPADTILVRQDPRTDAENVRVYIDRIARFGFADLDVSFVADAPAELRNEVRAVAEAVHRFGFAWSARPSAAASVRIVFESTPDPLDEDGVTILWATSGYANLRVERLAEVDLVWVGDAATADALRRAYPGLRVLLRVGSADHQAQAFLRAVGALVAADRPDRLPTFRRPRLLWVHGSRYANTTRQRALEVAEALSGLFEVRRILHADIDVADVAGADIVIIQRWTHKDLEHRARAFRLIAALRRRGKAFVYDIDDLIFGFGEGTPIDFMRTTDGVFVSTPQLAAHARRHNPDAWVVPNAIDAERLEGAERVGLSGHQQHIVVASSDALGVERLQHVANAVSKRFPQVHFHFFSYLEDPPAHPFITYHPVVSIDRLFAFCREATVLLNLGYSSQIIEKTLGIPPEDFDDFVNAKSEVKFQLAGLARTAFVTTSRPIIYRSIIQDGENGLIADDLDAQVHALVRLLADERLTARLADNAHAEVLAEHTVAQRWRRWADAIVAVNNERLRPAADRFLGPVRGVQASDSNDAPRPATASRSNSATSSPGGLGRAVPAGRTMYSKEDAVRRARAYAAYELALGRLEPPPLPSSWDRITHRVQREAQRLRTNPKAVAAMPGRLLRRLRKGL